MSENLLKILANSNKDIDNQVLMAYIKGQLSVTEAHDLEEEMLNSEFVADAVEGLDQYKDRDIKLYAEKINRELLKKLGKKKQRKEKRRLENSFWAYFAIFIILLLAIVSFIILKYHLA